MVAAFFVTVADDLEEHCSARLIEAETQNGATIRWFWMIFSAALSDAWNGLLEDAIA